MDDVGGDELGVLRRQVGDDIGDTVWLMSTYAPPKLWQCDRNLGWRVHDVDILDVPVGPT